MSDNLSIGEHLIPAEEFPAWAAKKIEWLERLLACTMGRAAGLEYGLITLMSAHHDPKGTNATWRRVTPELIDHEMAGPLFQTEEYRLSLAKTMSLLSEALEVGLNNAE